MESDFTRRIAHTLITQGAKIIPLVGGAMSSGLPDRMIIFRGNVFLCEFKGPLTPLKDNQDQIINDINWRAPGTAFIVRDATKLEGGNTAVVEYASLVGTTCRDLEKYGLLMDIRLPADLLPALVEMKHKAITEAAK